jgi:hypothetical protein
MRLGTRILYSLPRKPHNELGRAQRAKETGEPAEGLCGDIKGQSPLAGQQWINLVTVQTYPYNQ